MVAVGVDLAGTNGEDVADLTLFQKLLPNILNMFAFGILWVVRFFLMEKLFAKRPQLIEELVGEDFIEAVEGADKLCRRGRRSGRPARRRRPLNPVPVDPELRARAEAARGFMPPDEGLALLRGGAATCPSAARRCSRSAATAASRRSTSAPPPRERDTVLFALDHHRGSEENQPGWEWHEPDLVDPERRDASTRCRAFRRTIHDAGLEASVVALVGDSPTVGRHWQHAARRCCSSTAATAPSPRTATTRCGRPWVEPGGLLAIHDVFPDPADGGRPPYEIYCRALESGAFDEERAVGSLRGAASLLEPEPVEPAVSRAWGRRCSASCSISAGSASWSTNSAGRRAGRPPARRRPARSRRRCRSSARCRGSAPSRGTRCRSSSGRRRRGAAGPSRTAARRVLAVADDEVGEQALAGLGRGDPRTVAHAAHAHALDDERRRGGRRAARGRARRASTPVSTG